MASQKQIDANRRNALKSTGPQDTSRSRFNAARHALAGADDLLPEEHAEVLAAHLAAFTAAMTASRSSDSVGLPKRWTTLRPASMRMAPG